MDMIICDAKRFDALSQPVRLMVLYLIVTYEGRLSVNGLLNALAANMYVIEQPTLSHHLRILREAGFIEAEGKTGTERFYYLRGEALVYCMDAISTLARGREARVAS